MLQKNLLQYLKVQASNESSKYNKIQCIAKQTKALKNRWKTYFHGN